MKHISAARGVMRGFFGLRSTIKCDGCWGEFTVARQVSNTSSNKNNIIKYPLDEQTKILSVLNGSPVTVLMGYDLTKRRASNLEYARLEYGAFSSLDEVLTVPGIGSRCLKRLCDSILNGNIVSDGQEQSKKKLRSASRSPLLTPALSRDEIDDLNMVIGIHLGVNMVSWAGISRNGTLDHWDALPVYGDVRKIHPSVILNMAIEICRALPKSDIYIMEDASTTNKTIQQQISSLTLQLQRSQLTVMLMTLLNTGLESSNQDWPTNNNRVYFLRSRVASKLFQVLVGTERVSAQTTVDKILTSQPEIKTEDLHYTPISVDWETQARFKSKDVTVRENMCQSLLLTMAFYDLVVHCRAQSLLVVNAR